MSPAPPCDLGRRTCVVTGASSGIGLEIARNLARAGGTVVLVCRDPLRGEAARAVIAGSAPAAQVELAVADLSRPREVRALAGDVVRRHPSVGVLVNNAAVWAPTRSETADGVELTWATNVLAYHLLARLLIPALRAGAPSRIVNVASLFALPPDLDDPELRRRPYDGVVAYRRSKAADRMLTWALARRLAGTGVDVHAVHPGGVATGIYRAAPGLWGRLLRGYVRAVKLSPARGADTPTWAALAPELSGRSGLFLSRRREVPCTFRGEVSEERLWALCEERVGRIS